MFGTVASFTIKEGAEDQLVAVMKVFESANVPGHISSAVYRLRDGERRYIMATRFADEASYRANAESPEQNERFMQLRELLRETPSGTMATSSLSRRTDPYRGH